MDDVCEGQEGRGRMGVGKVNLGMMRKSFWEAVCEEKEGRDRIEKRKVNEGMMEELFGCGEVDSRNGTVKDEI